MIDAVGLLAARVAVGLSYASHGTQKAFGWFGGPGPAGAAGFMESLGFKPGAPYAAAASYGEIAGGLLIALGAGGPIGPALVVSGMTVAAETVHKKNGFYAGKGGIELNVLYASAAVAFASSGYGALSVDRALGIEPKTRHPIATTLALAAGILSAYAVLAKRDFTPPDGTLATPTVKGGEQNGSASTQAAQAGG